MLVLLTRPTSQAGATAGRLAALGHQALLAPVLAIVPGDEPPPDGPFDAVLLTSANAVPALARRWERFRGTRILAAGRRTAEAAREAGFGEVDEADGDAVALVNLVTRSLPRDSRVLHAAGRERKAEPARSLAAQGYGVEIWESYVARAESALPRDAADALRAGRIDAVLHYSRRSAALFVDVCRRAGLAAYAAMPLHLCLSPDVTEGLGALAGLRLRIAARPDETSLLDCLGNGAANAGSRPPQSG